MRRHGRLAAGRLGGSTGLGLRTAAGARAVALARVGIARAGRGLSHDARRGSAGARRLGFTTSQEQRAYLRAHRGVAKAEEAAVAVVVQELLRQEDKIFGCKI